MSRPSLNSKITCANLVCRSITWSAVNKTQTILTYPKYKDDIYGKFSGANEYIKIIYLNCGERYEFVTDHRSYTLKLSSCEIKAWKKIQACTGLAPRSDGLTAHFVESCTGIADVMGSNPVQAWISFRL